jgi:hypothetical protein
MDFPPKIFKGKTFLLLISLHGLLFCSPELFIHRYMYRNVHTEGPLVKQEPEFTTDF